MITSLGAIFLVGYALSLVKLRRGVLVVLACSLAFNDSAAIVVGEATVTPFYLGVILYLAVSVLSPSLRTADEAPAKRGLLLAMLAIAVLNACIAPAIFEGMGVVAPGIGLDQQVGHLSALKFSMSGFAQLAYLALNLGLVYVNERDRLLAQRHLEIGLIVGVLVALWAAASWRLGGLAFPQELFDNNPRGQYIESPGRLRAQFTEASHLGGFALAAMAFFLARSFGSSIRLRKTVYAVFALGSGLLLVSTSSGTATIGALVAVAVLCLLGLSRLAPRGPSGIHIAPGVFLAGVGLVVATALVSNRLVEAVRAVIEGKLGGASLHTRTYVDGRAFQLMIDTWGFGVGLGNNRSSSMILMLFSTLGVLGTVLFAAIALRSIRHGFDDPDRRAASIALIAFISAAAVSLADFVSPVMWLAIVLCYTPNARIEPEPALLPLPRSRTSPAR